MADMKDEAQPKLSPLGAGFRRLWAEKEIVAGRFISAAALARAASGEDGPVQARAPWSIILGRDTYSAVELARLLRYFGATVEDTERIGRGDHDHIVTVKVGWGRGEEAGGR